MPSVPSTELIAGLVSFLLTLMVFSYLWKDNALFRVAIYLFVGVSAGYVGAVACRQVLLPRLILPLLQGDILAVFPLLLGLALLGKLSQRTAALGNPSLALMVGVGAAVAVGGAVLGTLIPQVQATINNFELDPARSISEQILDASTFLVGTVTTLVYFHYGARPGVRGPQRRRMVTVLGWVGQIFVAVTFGVIFAGVYAAALTALIERLSSLRFFLGSLF
jgi:hypothetical protein